MFTMNKMFDKFTNYNAYYVANRAASKEVDETRLAKIIQALRDLLKKPYIRFMWLADAVEASCIVYDGSERVTKLVPISEIEKMIEERNIHR